jgi:DNA-binding transcriptional ArsR family regulator
MVALCKLRVYISLHALSWHMNQLKHAGIILAEKTGVYVRYSLADDNTYELILCLSEQIKVADSAEGGFEPH